MSSGELRERMNMGVPLADAFEAFDSDSDQALKSAKTLFEADNENIRLRTDLSDHEIKLLSKLRYFHKLVDIEGLDQILIEFMMLKVSKDRKSRKEFVETVKTKDRSSGFFSRFGSNQ